MKKRCLYVALIAIIIDLLFRVVLFDLLFEQNEIAQLKPYLGTMSAIQIYFLILFVSYEARQVPIKMLLGFLSMSFLFKIINLFLDNSSYPQLIGLALGGVLSYLIYRIIRVEEPIK